MLCSLARKVADSIETTIHNGFCAFFVHSEKLGVRDGEKKQRHPIYVHKRPMCSETYFYTATRPLPCKFEVRKNHSLNVDDRQKRVHFFCLENVSLPVNDVR